MKNNIKKIILAAIIIIFLSLILIDNPIRNLVYDWLAAKTPLSYVLPKRKQHCINIFVHGSFGSILGFLSLQNVIKDDVDGTNYKNLTKKMRENEFFYDSQPILQKGLVKIEPTFDIKITKNKKLIAYPIIKAYQTIAEKIIPQTQVNHFYTYGWSGLLSSKRRMKESIRFFNELNTEIEKYRLQGINPKIRILAHSHGGNLVLNLAAINKILTSTKDVKKYSEDENENESLISMAEKIKKLPDSPKKIKNKISQKIWDYIPKKFPLIIDEIVFYGVPIQPETEPFYFDETFRKTYSFYSKEDYVQEADWVSSKRPYSEQRITHPRIKKKENKIIQAKLMIGREIKDNKLKTMEDDKIDKIEESNPSILKKIFRRKKIFKQYIDPTHKELWFACWQQDTEKKKELFGGFPVAILTPIFIQAIEKLNIDDVDINIDKEKNNYVISVTKHNEEEVKNKINFSFNQVKKMIPKFALWKPNEDSKAKEFSIINGYLN